VACERRTLSFELENLRARRVRFSKTALEMEHAAQQLAKQFRTDEWQVVHARLQQRKVAESAAFEQAIGERDANELAQKLGQFQPFLAVPPQECKGQLASFGPT
jgi:hypothetical protein